MADQLYLSYWIQAADANRPLRLLELFLKTFPVSRLRPSALLRVYAINFQEAALTEQYFDDITTPQPLLELARKFQADDQAWQVELSWDIWQYQEEWRLEPARVAVKVFGAAFEREEGEHILLELGVDSLFLPHPDLEASARLIESNVRSLLRMVHEMDEKLPMERRRLWTESGENFAARLRKSLENLP
jgi:hypothetical protein